MKRDSLFEEELGLGNTFSDGTSAFGSMYGLTYSALYLLTRNTLEELIHQSVFHTSGRAKKRSKGRDNRSERATEVREIHPIDIDN